MGAAIGKRDQVTLVLLIPAKKHLEILMDPGGSGEPVSSAGLLQPQCTPLIAGCMPAVRKFLAFLQADANKVCSSHPPIPEMTGKERSAGPVFWQ